MEDGGVGEIDANHIVVPSILVCIDVVAAPWEIVSMLMARIRVEEERGGVTDVYVLDISPQFHPQPRQDEMGFG